MRGLHPAPGRHRRLRSHARAWRTPTLADLACEGVGQPVVTVCETYTIAGCALHGSTSPPCVTGQWIVGAHTCSPAACRWRSTAASRSASPPPAPDDAGSSQTRVQAS